MAPNKDPNKVVAYPVDPECTELARLFLRDSDLRLTESRVRSLAASIQLAIENWFEDPSA